MTFSDEIKTAEKAQLAFDVNNKQTVTKESVMYTSMNGTRLDGNLVNFVREAGRKF